MVSRNGLVGFVSTAIMVFSVSGPKPGWRPKTVADQVRPPSDDLLTTSSEAVMPAVLRFSNQTEYDAYTFPRVSHATLSSSIVKSTSFSLEGGMGRGVLPHVAPPSEE